MLARFVRFFLTLLDPFDDRLLGVTGALSLLVRGIRAVL